LYFNATDVSDDGLFLNRPTPMYNAGANPAAPMSQFSPTPLVGSWALSGQHQVPVARIPPAVVPGASLVPMIQPQLQPQSWMPTVPLSNRVPQLALPARPMVPLSFVLPPPTSLPLQPNVGSATLVAPGALSCMTPHMPSLGTVHGPQWTDVATVASSGPSTAATPNVVTWCAVSSHQSADAPLRTTAPATVGTAASEPTAAATATRDATASTTATAATTVASGATRARRK
jgi:hypothetical protein